jgi:tryptophan synthase beta chain
MAPSMARDAILLVNLSGRGDKDMHTVAERAGQKL